MLRCLLLLYLEASNKSNEVSLSIYTRKRIHNGANLDI